MPNTFLSSTNSTGTCRELNLAVLCRITFYNLFAENVVFDTGWVLIKRRYYNINIPTSYTGTITYVIISNQTKSFYFTDIAKSCTILLHSLMLAGNEFQSLGRAIVKEDEYEEVRWDGIVSIVSWRERVFRLWWEESALQYSYSMTAMTYGHLPIVHLSTYNSLHTYIEQRTNIKFCVLLHKTPAETLRLLEEAYGEAAQVYAWHKRFSGGRDSIKDDVRSGRPTTATNEAIAQRVRNVVRDDRRKTIKEIAAEVGISVGSAHNVLHKHLNMHYVSQKLVPKMLSAEQKETRMTLAGDMISMADEGGDFLNKIIAGDETWCYLYDPVPKRQSSEWKSKTSPRKQKFPRDTSKGKVMLEVFFDSQGLIHHEFIPEGRTVTKELYVEILRRLRDAVRRKRPEKWVENNWFLMHDNAPAHRAIIVKNFLAMHNITALDHPPYSPDLSPPDYFLFPV
ncbi:hypothetical protein ANN_14600 [Periplaneta americana]|uniref:Mariner transposase n=1 Tax=Periplaneta americana TaxID=6978 RepID=A0ABQ8SXE0_PERAM|nr:hypothetical protein ANN_14600 [Periplaneta americana]